MAAFHALSWHAGETAIHNLTRVPYNDNPTHPGLPPYVAPRLFNSPTIALGTTDIQTGEVWCTLWGSGQGPGSLVQHLSYVGRGVVGIRAEVDTQFDPFIQVLWKNAQDGAAAGEKVVKGGPDGAVVSGLSINLMDRDRVKLCGKVIVGSLAPVKDEATTGRTVAEDSELRSSTASAQLVLQITQSLGNCPKYLNKKRIISHRPADTANYSLPELVSSSAVLSREMTDHVHNADIFFVASRGPDGDMDCNHRGGAQGFLRVVPQDLTPPSTPKDGDAPTDTASIEPGSTLVWPEYSGNNLYQTLGNIHATHNIGLCVPNFASGDVLYLTGRADVLVNEAASHLLPRTRLAVKFAVTGARFVRNGLCGFRGYAPNVEPTKPIDTKIAVEGMSPYNPRVRYLTSERPVAQYEQGAMPPSEYVSQRIQTQTDKEAILVTKTQLTPSIWRYKFRVAGTGASASKVSVQHWKPGQYVALDFSEELYMGYSHMNDHDPTSLNDDFIRSFTITSAPYNDKDVSSTNVDPSKLKPDEFEITVRSVGRVTEWLASQRPERMEVRVAIRGFEGDFSFVPSDKQDLGVDKHDISIQQGIGDVQGSSVFIAAGVGITPLLGQISLLEELGAKAGAGQFLVLWTVSVQDVGLVEHVLSRCPQNIVKAMRIFLTRDEDKVRNQDKDLLKQLLTNAAAGRSVKSVEKRRLLKSDVESLDKNEEVQNWFICANPALRKLVEAWAPGRLWKYENFDY